MADKTGLQFISTNPATAAFEHGQAVALQQEQMERQAEGQMLQNAENLAAAPSRLRTVKANSDLATTNADVAQRTAPYKVQTAAAGARTAGANADVAVGTVGSRIATSGANARRAGAEADVAVGTVQPRIDTAQAGARTAGATADVAQGTVDTRIRQGAASSRLAEVNADVADRTADAKVETAQAGARSASARAAQAEMDGFFKSLELLNAGDVASAQEVARMTGQQIPQQVIDDAQLRREITEAANYAKTAYPNRPKDAQAYMQGYLKQRLARHAEGQTQYDPTAVYTVEGAPQPPEISSTAQQHQAAELQVAQWLINNKVAANAQEAWDMVRRSKANPQTIYAQVYNNALRSTFGDQKKAKQIADEFMMQMNAGVPGTQPARPAAPAAAPVPGAQPGAPTSALQPPPGAGTRQSPYQATTQDHVNWFRNSAPPGSVLFADGRYYQK
jgi:hypothetical protein